MGILFAQQQPMLNRPNAGVERVAEAFAAETVNHRRPPSASSLRDGDEDLLSGELWGGAGTGHHSARCAEGEFKRSSQHYVRRSCDAEAKKAPIRSCGQAAPTVAGAAWLGSTGTEAAILGRDRRRPVERGRRRGRGRIVSCRLALVPRKWRDAFNQPDATLGTLPLVP